jgi:DNA-binding NarL/FixJ family response regulator
LTADPATSGPIRVLIVDDDVLVRGALTMMLAGSDQVVVVGAAEDGSQVADAVRRHAPDVVLMDIRMPQMDGLAATEQLCAGPSAPKIIILTTFDVDDHVLRAVRAGASGYLLKDTPPNELIRAITLVAAGEAMLSPAVTRTMFTHITGPVATTGAARRAKAKELLSQLSERELEVAQAIGEGKSNAEIGAELFMSLATVKTHVSRLLAKLELNNRVQIALMVHDFNGS